MLSHWRSLFRSSVAAPAEMRQGSVQCLTNGQLHRMAYTEWGRADNPRVLLCVHGLSRNGRDFDVLAQALSKEFRVVCPDVAGRGESEWLHNSADYTVPNYLPHMLSLIARLNVLQLDWLGTSMGGLIGMNLAAMADSPIRKLILNDVGPVLSAPALTRIGEYVGRAPHFASLAEAEAYLRRVCPGFGPLSPEQWHHLSVHGLRREGEGWRVAYDPGIGEAMRSMPIHTDILMWPVYDAIRAPTLVMRGVDSDLLTHATALAMCARGPRARMVEIADTGHAPMLMDTAQIELVREFLLSPENETSR